MASTHLQIPRLFYCSLDVNRPLPEHPRLILLNMWSSAGGAVGKALESFRRWKLPVGSGWLRVGLDA